MILGIAIGLWPFALAFVVFGFCVARTAKKRGKKRPWLWGWGTIVLIIALSWPNLFRWAGWAFAIQMEAIHKFHSPEDSNRIENSKLEKFNLPAKGGVYIFTLPAAYRADYFPEIPLIRIDCKYPTMEASPGSGLSEGVVNIRLALNTMSPGGPTSRAQFFLDQVDSTKISDNKAFYHYAGKQGNYDVFQRQEPVAGKTETVFLFTSEDGELVMVKRNSFAYRVWRNVSPDLSLDYSFFPLIGSDFIEIDEAVSEFIKARRTSQKIQKIGVTRNRNLPRQADRSKVELLASW